MSHFALRAALAGALLTAGVAGASAADLNHYTPAPAPANIVAMAFNWTGAYVGANIGANWATVSNPNGTSSALAGGLQAGYLWQAGQFVYGIEGDVDYNGNRRTTAFAIGANTYNDREKLDWSFGVRGRLGYAFDRVLPFVSAGITFANLNSRVTNTTAGAGFGVTDSKTNLRTGVQVGGGLEYAFTNNITARGEYIYSYYGRNTVGYDNNGFALRHTVSDNALRFSINYKF
jgi:outer membrane immunogenic protein